MRVNECGKLEYRAVVLGDLALTGPEHENLSEPELLLVAKLELEKIGENTNLIENVTIGIFTSEYYDHA